MSAKLLIPLSIIIAGLFIAGAFVYVNQGLSGGLSAQEAGEKAINYINKNKDRVAGGLVASLISVSEEGSVYKIHIKVGEGEYDSYVTKDGKFLFPNSYDLEAEAEIKGGEPTSQSEPSGAKELSPDRLEALAKCLSEKGDKFYGASWCSWCNRQKESFGEAAQFLPYIECVDEETNKTTPACEEAGISSFPTWIIGGKKQSGFKEPGQLTELSGCPL